jgi:hypothetical protein
MDFSDLKLKIPQLPSSPFVHMSLGRALSEDGTESTEDIHVRGHSTALVPSRQGGSRPERRDSRTLRGAPDSPRESEATGDDNTLDAVRMMESQRMSLENADGLDLYAFRASLDSNPGVRLVSTCSPCRTGRQSTSNMGLLSLFVHFVAHYCACLFCRACSQVRTAAAAARSSRRTCPSPGPSRRLEHRRRTSPR